MCVKLCSFFISVSIFGETSGRFIDESDETDASDASRAPDKQGRAGDQERLIKRLNTDGTTSVLWDSQA